MLIKLDKPKKQYILLAVCMAVIGLIFLVRQLITGFDGYSNHYPWGIYIACFFAAAAGGGGLLIITGLGILKGMIETSEAKRLYTLAVAMLVTAGFLIFADIGSPAAIFNMLFSANFKAPMTADAWSLGAAVLISLLAALLIEKNEKNLKGFAIAGGVVGFILLGVESWLLATSVRQDLWPVMLGAGPALLQALAIGFSAILLVQPRDKRYWKNALLITLALLLIVQFTDVLASIGNQNHLGFQIKILVSSPTFWLASIGMAIALMIGIFAGKDNPETGLKAIAIIAVLSVAISKLAVIWAGEAYSAISQLAFSEGPHFAISELLVTIGMIGLGMLVYMLVDWIVQVYVAGRITVTKGASI